MIKWKTYRLGDITIMRNGKKRPNTQGIYPVYGGNGIMDYADCYNAENAIIVGRVGAYCGNVYQSKGKCWVSDNAISVSATELVDSYFLYYLMSSIDFHHHHIGGAQPLMTQDIIGGFEIFLPSLDEQKRIAGVLGAIDNKIENNRRINANLELQAQALFGNLISNSNLEYKPIADIEHLIETGRRPKGGVANIANGVPSIGAENIKGLGKYDYSKTKYITEEFAQSLKKGFIKGYELLIYKDGGKPGYFIPNFSIFGEGFPYENMALNEHVFLLDFGDRGYNFFAYFYMQTEEVMKYLNAQGSKAAIPGINRNDVESITIPTIENKTVKEFCVRVEPIISAILTNAKESNRLATLRDTLLPKLMNGELSVGDVSVD